MFLHLTLGDNYNNSTIISLLELFIFDQFGKFFNLLIKSLKSISNVLAKPFPLTILNNRFLNIVSKGLAITLVISRYHYLASYFWLGQRSWIL